MDESKRPYHGPKQVRTLKGVKPGHFYYECNRKIKKNLIVALSHPLLIENEHSFWFVEWPLMNDAGFNPRNLMECSQLSIVPLAKKREGEKNYFHQTNWLERCHKTPLNIDQVEDLWDYLPLLDV